MSNGNVIMFWGTFTMLREPSTCHGWLSSCHGRLVPCPWILVSCHGTLLLYHTMGDIFHVFGDFYHAICTLTISMETRIMSREIFTKSTYTFIMPREAGTISIYTITMSSRVFTLSRDIWLNCQWQVNLYHVCWEFTIYRDTLTTYIGISKMTYACLLHSLGII
jgi:hypothetical protein